MKIYKEQSLGYWEGLFYSIIMWTAVSSLTFFFAVLDVFIVFPLSVLLDHGTRWKVHQVSIFWARGIIRWNPIWRLRVMGRLNLEKGRNYVIVSNHQSLLDILVVCAALPLNFKFLAKKELFYVPFMGWAMLCAGYIPVNRSSHESGKQALLKIGNTLKRGVSVLLFPEGTRSPDGKIHAFKSGAFKLARDHQVAILPVVVEGTGRALPKKSFFLRKRSTFVVSIGKPVSIENTGDKSIEKIREEIRHEMIGRLEHIRHQRQG